MSAGETQPLSTPPSSPTPSTGNYQSNMTLAFETDIGQNRTKSPVTTLNNNNDNNFNFEYDNGDYHEEQRLYTEEGEYVTNKDENDFSSIIPANRVPYHDLMSPHYTIYSKVLPYFLLCRLFPPDVPRPVQLLRKENLAVPMCYLVVGILQGLSGPFINVYPLFLGATEAQQTTISSIRSLPALFKIGFGFWSDNFSLWGYRRKSYMLIGWLMSGFSMLCLLMFSDMSRVLVNNNNNDNGMNVTYEPPEDSPSIPFLSSMLLLFGTGFWFADVMGDSLVAEKAKLEPEATRGHLQSTCYSCRFFGLMVASPISTVLYSKYGPQLVVKLLASVPLIMVPFIYNLWERKDVEIKSTKDQCREIWNTVCSRAVWQPMAFVYIYNILQIGNAAWREFLRSILQFTYAQLNTLLIVANVLLYVGVIAYKYCFITWSWRSIYIITTALNGLFSSFQVLLIKGITFGLSPFVFALGDDLFADFLGGIQFLVSRYFHCVDTTPRMQ